MKILESEIRKEIRREIHRESLLLESAFKSGDGVNIKGIDADGVVRANHKMHMLVHWTGKDALKKIPERKHIRKWSDLNYIRKGDVQSGWTWGTVKAIFDRYPAKGFFTIETPSTIESQTLTGKTADGGATGTGVAGEDLGGVIDTLASGVAFVADFFPGPGTALSASIGVSQALNAISKAAWLAAGLSLIALIPAMGDAWKAAFPWMKWLARLEKAKTITLSATAIALLTDMVANWDKYKSGFKEMVGKATHASDKKQEITGTVLDKIIAAVDEAVDEIRDILPKKTVTAESTELTRSELRGILINEYIGSSMTKASSADLAKARGSEEYKDAHSEEMRKLEASTERLYNTSKSSIKGLASQAADSADKLRTMTGIKNIKALARAEAEETFWISRMDEATSQNESSYLRKKKYHIKLTRGELRAIVQNTLDEGKPASKSTGKPYKGSRRGKTESQAQQMAAGIALRAREEGSKESAIRKLKGASKEMAKMSMKDLRKLATIRRGSEVPDSTKKGHERAALPGHIKKGKK